MAWYDAHNALVTKTLAPARLVTWQASHGWEPLCDALDMPVPDEPPVHTNTRDEFLARAKENDAKRGD